MEISRYEWVIMILRSTLSLAEGSLARGFLDKSREISCLSTVPLFRKKRCFLLLVFVLLLTATCEWSPVWCVDGILSGKNCSTLQKPYHSATLSTTNLSWTDPWIEPRPSWWEAAWVTLNPECSTNYKPGVLCEVRSEVEETVSIPESVCVVSRQKLRLQKVSLFLHWMVVIQ
jgi:hypothetical protein